MPLESCPTCRRSISIEATSCPKCGQPLEHGWGAKAKAKRERNAGIAFGIVAFVFVSVVVYMNMGGGHEAQSGPTVKVISAAEYGTDWPFTRSVGTLSCIDARPGGVPRPYVIVRFDGVEYGLNGAAMGAGGYTPAQRVTQRDADGFFTIGDVGRLIKEGIELCRRSY